MPRSTQSGASANFRDGRRSAPRQPQQQLQKVQQSSSTNNGHLATEKEYNYLLALRDGYKSVAIAYNRSGNKAKALSMLRISKQLSLMTRAVEEKRPVDLHGLPPMPPKISSPPPPPPSRRTVATFPAKDQVTNRPSTQVDAAPSRERIHPEIERQLEQVSLNVSQESAGAMAPMPPRAPLASCDDDVARLFDAPTSASSIMEALQQRLEKYQSTMKSASAEGNASKARRLGRIVKQYENAISATTKGGEFDYDSLPTPPGYPPIPRPSHRTVIRVAYDPTPKVNAFQPSPQPSQVRPATELNAKVDALTHQQNVLKKAAVASKEAGDKTKALELFRLAKGLDNIIEAVKCGLPYDPQSIPTQLDQLVSDLESHASV